MLILTNQLYVHSLTCILGMHCELGSLYVHIYTISKITMDIIYSISPVFHQNKILKICSFESEIFRQIYWHYKLV